MSKVELRTNLGTIVLQVDAGNAPRTAENFIQYVEDGFYNGTLFRLAIKGFKIQGGGFMPGMEKKQPRESINNEANNGLKNRKYTVAMARKSDPHSATAEFFINLADNASLDHTGENPQGWGYAVFGEVIEGREVVDAIGAVSTGPSAGFNDVPKEDVIIELAEVIE